MAAEWVTRGACRGMDPAIFYPTDDAGHGEAKAVCARCPVRQPCLDLAMARGEQHGIWGGLSAAERAGSGRRRGLAPRAERGALTIAQVVEEAARICGVTVAGLLAQRGAPSLVEARNVAMAAARQASGASFPVIARHFGRRHHDTVMLACRSVMADDRLAQRARFIAANAEARRREAAG